MFYKQRNLSLLLFSFPLPVGFWGLEAWIQLQSKFGPPYTVGVLSVNTIGVQYYQGFLPAFRSHRLHILQEMSVIAVLVCKCCVVY